MEATTEAGVLPAGGRRLRVRAGGREAGQEPARAAEAGPVGKARAEGLLKSAAVKISSVITDLHGMTGRDMMDHQIAGEHDPRAPTQLARGKARPKIARSPGQAPRRQARQPRLRSHPLPHVRTGPAKAAGTPASWRSSARVRARRSPARHTSTCPPALAGGLPAAKRCAARTGDAARANSAAAVAAAGRAPRTLRARRGPGDYRVEGRGNDRTTDGDDDARPRVDEETDKGGRCVQDGNACFDAAVHAGSKMFR